LPRLVTAANGAAGIRALPAGGWWNGGNVAGVTSDYTVVGGIIFCFLPAALESYLHFAATATCILTDVVVDF